MTLWFRNLGCLVYMQKRAIIVVKNQVSYKYKNGRTEMVKDNIKTLMNI